MTVALTFGLAMGLVGFIVALALIRQERQAHAISERADVTESADVTLRFVYVEEPALQLVNKSNVLARDIKWEVTLWNLDRPIHAPSNPLQIDNGFGEWLRPNSSRTKGLFALPQVKPHVARGDRLLGWASVSCPDCVRTRTFIVYVPLGSRGWFTERSHVPNGDIIIPRQLRGEQIEQYLRGLLDQIPGGERTPIPDSQ
jgi:hypothetical protein